MTEPRETIIQAFENHLYRARVAFFLGDYEKCRAELEGAKKMAENILALTFSESNAPPQ